MMHTEYDQCKESKENGRARQLKSPAYAHEHWNIHPIG